MHRDPAALCRTVERKQAFVLSADDASFVGEVIGFLRWALADVAIREHLVALLEPPDEVTRFVQAAPGLVADAGDVINWMRAKEPAACAQVAEPSAWEECERVVSLAREGSSPEVVHRAGHVFGMLGAARDAVGRSFRDRTDDESVAAWRAAVDLAQRFERQVRERNLAARVSPGAALVRLVASCRAASAPEDGTKHWTDFTRGAIGFAVAPLEDAPSARLALRRVVEGLLTSLEGVPRGRTALRRFVARTASFDAERVARSVGPEAEAALTRDLARYLHDAGLPVVSRAGARRADASISERAIVARAVVSASGDPRALVDAVRALRAELVALDAAGFDVDEGLMAVFVVGGASLDLPQDVAGERFTIRIEAADLRSGDRPDHDARVRISAQMLAATS